MTKHTNDQKISRKVLTVSINKDAYHKLHELSEIEGIKKWQMLSRIIIQSIRNKHYKVNERWVNDLLNPVNRTIKYKGTKGRKQISYQISEAAWNKLECHKTASGLSKARIIQSIILNFKPTTHEQRERFKQSRIRIQEDAEQWLALYLIPKEIKPNSKFVHVGDGEYIHATGIGAEAWNDEEILEHENLKDKYLLAR